MLFEMYAKVKMDRPIDKNKDYVSAGGYSVLADNILYRFDFIEYAIEIDKEDASIIHINGRYPDYDVFPTAERITADILKDISIITEFFIFTGEPDEDGAAPLELLECEFEISDTQEVIKVSKDICKGAYITRGF